MGLLFWHSFEHGKKQCREYFNDFLMQNNNFTSSVMLKLCE